MDEEFNKFASLVDEYFKTVTWTKPVESSDTHASSSSALPVPDDGSTNVVQAPVPNPASSTANPNPLMEPWSPSSTPSPAVSDSEDYEWLFEPEGDDSDTFDRPLHTPTLSGYGLDHELNSAPSTNVGQAPVPNPASSTPNPNPLIKPSSPSSTASPSLSDSEDYGWLYEPESDGEIHGPLHTMN
jgi:hypothetical protein